MPTEGTRASATALEVLVAALSKVGLEDGRQLVEQIYGVEERVQFDRERNEAPGRIRDAVAVYLAARSAGTP